MNAFLFFIWLLLAFAVFLYSASARDWRGIFFGIAACMFFGLALASFDIEFVHVFYNETSGEVVTHIYHDYSIANSYLCLAMGMISVALTFYKAITAGLIRRG